MSCALGRPTFRHGAHVLVKAGDQRNVARSTLGRHTRVRHAPRAASLHNVKQKRYASGIFKELVCSQTVGCVCANRIQQTTQKETSSQTHKHKTNKTSHEPTIRTTRLASGGVVGNTLSRPCTTGDLTSASTLKARTECMHVMLTEKRCRISKRCRRGEI